MTYSRPGVYVSERDLPTPVTSVGTADAAGACIGYFSKGPEAVTRVSSWYEFATTYGDLNPLYPATYGISQFFQNGGGELYVRRVTYNAAVSTVNVVSQTSGTNTTKFVSKYKGTDANLLRVKLTPIVTTRLAATAIDYASNTVTVTAANNLAVGDIVTISGATFGNYNTTVVELPVATASATGFTVTATVSGTPATSTATIIVYSNYWDLVVAKETVANESPDVFGNDIILETYNNVLFNNKLSSDYIGTILALRSQYIRVDETSGTFDATKRPVYANPLVFTGGSDGAAPDAAEYTGTSNAVLKEFDVLERPLVVFAPELGNQITATFTEADVQTVQNAMTNWAESNGKAFVVLDTQAGKTPTTAIAYSNSLVASSSAGIYYPNYYVPDSKAQSSNALRLVSPSSAVAGLMLATDRSVGPHKSAAGISAKLANAVALEYAFTSTDLDNLNVATNPVNAIRNLPGAGIVVMGGRTLKASSSITKYISTRRSLFYIKRQMEVLTQFALFENNSEVLWSRIRTTLSAFLTEYRNQGGLRGETIDQSFYIKVDAENNDATSIAAGIVNVEVGVALERPAEFVVITLSQMTTI
jgi:phage tail sheath protein FI